MLNKTFFNLISFNVLHYASGLIDQKNDFINSGRCGPAIALRSELDNARLYDAVSKALYFPIQLPQVRPYEDDSALRYLLGRLYERFLGLQIRVLTGLSTRGQLPIENLSDDVDLASLQRNLLIAEQINRVMHGKLQIVSSNFPYRKTGLWEKFPETEGEVSLSRVAEISETFFRNRKLASLDDHVSSSLQSRVGNCCELVCLAHRGLSKAYPDLLVREVSLVGGDHEFLLLGSEKDGVVLDVWSNAFFVKSQAGMIGSYVGEFFCNDGKTYNTVVDLSPRKWNVINSSVNLQNSSSDSVTDYCLKEDEVVLSAIVNSRVVDL